MPVVSVIVPNYNHARFLPRRLDSILAQTFKDYELIVLDDASTDNSRKVLEAYAAKHPLRLVFNEKNSGSPFIQWQKGAALAAGKYIWIAESDDYADPRLLEALVAQLQKNPKVGLAYCQSYSVDENNLILRTGEHWMREQDLVPWKKDYVRNGRDELTRHLVHRNTIPNASAVVARRDIFLQAVQQAEALRLTGDWWTWSRVLLQTDVAFLAEPMNFFRNHPGSVRGVTRLPMACAEELAVIAHICAHIEVPPEIRRAVFHEAFYKWRCCFELPGFRPGPQWLRHTRVSAATMDPTAAVKMAWFRARQKLKQIRAVATVVRAVKKPFRRAPAGLTNSH